MSTAIEPGSVDGDPLIKQACDNAEESLREKMVAYVQAVSASEVRPSVWMEHSYARARRAASSCRSLLVRVPPSTDCGDEDGPLDVLSVEERPAPPLSPRTVPQYELALSEEDIMSMNEADDELDDWEEKLEALAPTPAHRRLITAVLEIIRSLRMERLAVTDYCGSASRSHARRLRKELAPLWNAPGPLQQRPAAWMHAVLSAYLPRPYLQLYNEMISELARLAPKLAERLLAGQIAPAPPELEIAGPKIRSAPDRPLLVWLPSGREKRDVMWENALGQVMPVHRIPAPIVNACSPEAWCTAMASATRTALSTLTGAPNSGLVLGGWGAGAALALHAAATWDTSVALPKALVLLSPPLLTAEGPRDMMDDPMLQLKMPILFVVGQNAMQCTVNMAEEAVARLGPRSRAVVVGAADDCLRLTNHKLRMERLTPSMVEAAIAEEVKTFVMRSMRDETECREPDSTEDAPSDEPEPTAAAPAPPARRRVPPPVAAAPAKRYRCGRGLALFRVSSSPIESATLQPPSGGGRTASDWEDIMAADSYQPKRDPRQRNIRITENIVPRGSILNGASSKGFSVVTRGTGSVPLSLPPPRRAAAAPPLAAPLDTADIMQLPIVFADDDHELEVEPPPQLVTPTTSKQIVRLGNRGTDTAVKYTKVILAKRPAPPPPQRPIVVKGGMKILPSGLVIKRRSAPERREQ